MCFLFLAQVKENVEYPDSFASLWGDFLILFLIGLVVYIVISVFFIMTMWKIFAKANKPGWAAIIPIYNVIVLLEIVGRPIWWIILLMIPCVNIVISIILIFDLAKSFGKDAAFGIGILFLSVVFLPILAFSSNIKYVGPAAAPPVNPFQQPPYQPPPQG